MPLTPKGEKILSRMTKSYGPKKAKQIFYAMVNERKLSGVEGKTKKEKMKAAPKKTKKTSKKKAVKKATAKKGKKVLDKDKDGY